MRYTFALLSLGLAIGLWPAANLLAADPVEPMPEEKLVVTDETPAVEEVPPAAEEPATTDEELPSELDEPAAAEEPAPAPEEEATPAPAEEATPPEPAETVSPVTVEEGSRTISTETPLRPVDVQEEAVEAQTLAASDLTGMNEVALAEEVARARKAYVRALEAMRKFYDARGNAVKTRWVEEEIAAQAKVPDTKYLTVAEIAGPELKPLRSIPAADALYKEGVDYKNYPAFPPAKKDYLNRALEKFETIIKKYPDSDKIDDAAFRMGEIYGGWYFKDWARAVQAYERCWQWNPKTEYPAVFNAAKIYDESLQNRVKAVELYNRVIAESPDTDLQNQARQRIKALTGK